MNRIENLESKFRFVHAAARRTRQIQNGSRPLVPTGSRKPSRIAMEEILSNAVTFELAEEPKREPMQE